MAIDQPPPSVSEARLPELEEALLRLGPYEACELLERESDQTIAKLLSRENPAIADEILWTLPNERRERVLAAAPAEQREQWSRNHEYPEDSVGRLMDRPLAVLVQNQTVAEAIERLRPIVQRAFVTYGWVVDTSGKLVGVLVFRELLFAEKDRPSPS